MRYDVRSWSELEKASDEISEGDLLVMHIGVVFLRARIENIGAMLPDCRQLSIDFGSGE